MFKDADREIDKNRQVKQNGKLIFIKLYFERIEV